MGSVGVARTFMGREASKQQGFRAIALDTQGRVEVKIFRHHRPSQSTHPIIPNANFAERFFAPARTHLHQAPSARVCPELSDDQWLLLGVRRVLEDRPTGRGFLQHLLAYGLEAPTTTHFFETLKSQRRRALIAERAHGLARSLPALEAEFWAGVPELDGFETYAGDGHFHAAAAHDSAAADQLTRKREHDRHALNRLSLEELRQGAPKGRQVLSVYDRAGIDFQPWHRGKHSGGLCFVSREPSRAR